MRNGAGTGNRPHGAAEDERHDDSCLVGAGIGAQHIGHGAVPDQRRVDIDIAEDDAVPVDEIAAEDDPGHFNRILGTAFRRDRAHETAVRIFQVRMNHVEVALVDRNVYRFADRAAGMVQPGA